jgi:hypothetical protein
LSALKCDSILIYPAAPPMMIFPPAEKILGFESRPGSWLAAPPSVFGSLGLGLAEKADFFG